MHWVKINPEIDRTKYRNQFPKNKPFLALFKGSIALCEYDEDLDHFFIGIMPASYLGFWKLDRDRECKITHICMLEMPEDY